MNERDPLRGSEADLGATIPPGSRSVADLKEGFKKLDPITGELHPADQLVELVDEDQRKAERDRKEQQAWLVKERINNQFLEFFRGKVLSYAGDEWQLVAMVPGDSLDDFKMRVRRVGSGPDHPQEAIIDAIAFKDFVVEE